MTDEYTKLVTECADQGKALARMMANEGASEPMYLYCRPSTKGRPGRLLLVRDSKAPYQGLEDGLELVTGEGLRMNVPYSNFFQWVYDRAKRAPILSIDEA